MSAMIFCPKALADGLKNVNATGKFAFLAIEYPIQMRKERWLRAIWEIYDSCASWPITTGLLDLMLKGQIENLTLQELDELESEYGWVYRHQLLLRDYESPKYN